MIELTYVISGHLMYVSIWCSDGDSCWGSLSSTREVGEFILYP